LEKQITDNFNLAARIVYGVKKGAAQARLEHKLAGRPIFVIENGKVVEIPPEKIEAGDDLPPPPI
jgi:hypothetical protein